MPNRITPAKAKGLAVRPAVFWAAVLAIGLMGWIAACAAMSVAGSARSTMDSIRIECAAKTKAAELAVQTAKTEAESARNQAIAALAEAETVRERAVADNAAFRAASEKCLERARDCMKAGLFHAAAIDLRNYIDMNGPTECWMEQFARSFDAMLKEIADAHRRPAGTD